MPALLSKEWLESPLLLSSQAVENDAYVLLVISADVHYNFLVGSVRSQRSVFNRIRNLIAF